jgi:hypothetical protein
VEDQFIEIRNRASHTIDLLGLALTAEDASGATRTIHSFGPQLLGSGEGLVLFSGSVEEAQPWAGAHCSAFNKPGHAGDGRVIDNLRFDLRDAIAIVAGGRRVTLDARQEASGSIELADFAAAELAPHLASDYFQFTLGPDFLGRPFAIASPAF